MIDCRRCRSWLIEAYYRELSQMAQEDVDKHLKECADCATEYKKIVFALTTMSRRKQADPGQEFWDSYYARLQQRMITGPLQPRESVNKPVRAWFYRVAAAIAFVTIGLLIGRYYFPTQEVKHAQGGPQTPGPSEVDVRTARFLERSQVLLVGMINIDPTAQNQTYDFSHQKQVSHHLVQEASYLKNELKDPRERKLRQLVSELQIILIQIASMEEQGDLRAVELVKSGVDRKGILLKINLEQMRMSDQESHQASKTKS